MPRKPNKQGFPQSEQQLRAWLRDTDMGRRLVIEEIQSHCVRCLLSPPRKVLVVVRRLGPLPAVQVFAEKGVNIRFEELVDTHDDPVIERLAEQLLIAQVPRGWKHLAEKGIGANDGMAFTGLTAEQRLRSLEALVTLRHLEAWAAKWL